MDNLQIAQEINTRIGNSPVPFDSVYSIALAIYQELGGEGNDFDSVYSILLEILPLASETAHVIDDSSISLTKTWSSSKISTELANTGFDVEIVTELPSVGDPHTIYFILKQDSSTGDYYDEWMYINGNWEKVGNTAIDLSDYATIDYVDEQIEAVAGTANSEIEGKQTEDFTFVTELPVSGEEDEQVIIKGENTDTLYKYVSGSWVEQTPDATKLYFDTENEALYSYVSVDHQFAPVSLVNTIIVGSNLNTNTALKAIKTPGVYSVVQRLTNKTKGDYIKNWTLTVEGIDYDEYDKSDSIYLRIQSNYTIQKRTWSSTRATNDGWSNFSTYYAGEIKDSTTSKYYTWSSNKLSSMFNNIPQLTAGDNISIEDGKINAEGYFYDDEKNSVAIGRKSITQSLSITESLSKLIGTDPDAYLTGAAGATTYQVSGTMATMILRLAQEELISLGAGFAIGDGRGAILDSIDTTNSTLTFKTSISEDTPLENEQIIYLYIPIRGTLSGAAGATTYSVDLSNTAGITILEALAEYLNVNGYESKKIVSVDATNSTVTLVSTLDNVNPIDNAEIIGFTYFVGGKAGGKQSHSEGDSVAYGDYSHAEGAKLEWREVEATYSWTEENPNILVGSKAEEYVSVGRIIRYNNLMRYITKVDGVNITINAPFNIFNTENVSIEYLSVGSVAYGIASHSEYKGKALGDYSHAEGNSIALGYYSHAEGDCLGGVGSIYPSNIAYGSASHAEGTGTAALGKGSHAEGGNRTSANLQWTIAEGDYSHAEGYATKATHQGEHAEGCYNISHKANNNKIDNNHPNGDAGNTQHSVGIGYYYWGEFRKNAFEIMTNGDMYVLGIGGYQGTNTKVQNATIKTLQEYIASLESRITALENPTTAS